MLFLGCFALAICACDIKKQYSSGKENKKTKISFWNGFTGPDGQTMWQIIKKFEQSSRDIASEVRSVLLEKLQEFAETLNP